MSGGFAHLPTLSKPFIIDTAQINTQNAYQLETMVRESDFFNQPAHVDSKTKGAADYRTYTITVEDGTNVHSVQLTDPIEDAKLQKLVSQLQLMSQQSTS